MKAIILFVVFVLAFSSGVVQAQEQMAKTDLVVTEAALGTGVENRELVGETTTFSVNDRAYLWMRITGGPVDSIAVTWKVDDYTWITNLHIGASTWRTWAYKTLWKAGDWSVTVSTEDGAVLKNLTFTVEEDTTSLN